MRSDAATVADYLAALPAERRDAIGQVRDVVNANLGDGFEERMLYGMVSWVVPLERYPGHLQRPAAGDRVAGQPEEPHGAVPQLRLCRRGPA